MMTNVLGNLSLKTRVLVVAASVATLTGCPGAPGELRPLFDSVTGLPAFLVEPDPPPQFQMPIRNVGETEVEITGFRIEDVDGAEGQAVNFYDLAFDITEIVSGDQSAMAFLYRTPNGAAQKALLVIESSSSVTPVIEIPLETAAYVAPPLPDGGVDDDAGSDDAGQGDDAGTVDAGQAVDAGQSVDAGNDNDAGQAADAGQSVDAGNDNDAGPATDAGAANDAG